VIAVGRSRKRERFSADERLCDLRKQLKEHLDEYRRLVRDPTHICRKCGRAARHADNLCKPEPL
jgi:hypothetical protein